MVLDTVSQVDVDGVTLNFIRGGDYLAFEDPVLEKFERQHGMDARKMQPNDERLLRTRASFYNTVGSPGSQPVGRDWSQQGQKNLNFMSSSIHNWKLICDMDWTLRLGLSKGCSIQ